jgi:hypothetical protein
LIGAARAEHDQRLGEQRHEPVGVRAPDRLDDLGDETLGVALGLLRADRRLLRRRRLGRTTTTTAAPERERSEYGERD